MRLIELTANKSSFHPVYFNREGLSIIVGRKRVSIDSDITETYNGVGKSLIIAIVHFCLGSTHNNLAFQESLKDWTFNLRFELDSTEHLVSRSTSDIKKFMVDEREMSDKEFKSWIEENTFIIDSNQRLSFRSLISRFIRPSKKLNVFTELNYQQILFGHLCYS